MDYISLPFEWLGRWLRRLSLSGDTGDTAAIILYVLLAGAPLVGIFYLGYRNRSEGNELLLLLLSGLTTFLLWFYVNPHCVGLIFRKTGNLERVPTLFAATMMGVLAGWVLLHLLYVGGKKEPAVRPRYLKRLSAFAIGLLIAVMLFQGMDTFEKEFCGGGAPENSLAVSTRYAMGVLEIFADRFPRLLVLGLVLIMFCFLSDYAGGQSRGESVLWLEYLGKYSGKFMTGGLWMYAGVSTGQIIMARRLFYNSYTLTFPLWELMLMLGVSQLCRLYLENRGCISLWDRGWCL